MSIYLWSLILGAAGLAAMAVSGLGARGGHSAAGARGHAGHVGHGGARGGHHTHVAAARGQHAAHAVGAKSAASRTVWAITSPRFLFSFFLGAGTAGEIAQPITGGVLQLAVAVLGGLALERFIVTPLWNLSMRFASTPAVTLESAVSDEATAVTAFDASGCGIVSLEMDGQVRQILATLRQTDQSLGVHVRAGQRVRIEDVNPNTNHCTVSLI